MTRALALHHLTALEVAPLDLPAVAARAGCQGVCLFTHLPIPFTRLPILVPFPVLEPGDRREMALRLDDAGVALTNIEFVWVAPEMDFETLHAPLALGAGLGARRIVVHVTDPEPSRAEANFARLCELAAGHGLDVGLEFMRFTAGCASLGRAVELVKRSGAANAAVAVDALHLIRTGGTPAEVAALEPTLFSYAQLCDGPLSMPEERQMAEAVGERMIPGQGRFPLAELIAALPADLPLDVEVPLSTLRASGVGPAERAARAVAGARAVLGE